MIKFDNEKEYFHFYMTLCTAALKQMYYDAQINASTSIKESKRRLDALVSNTTDEIMRIKPLFNRDSVKEIVSDLLHQYLSNEDSMPEHLVEIMALTKKFQHFIESRNKTTDKIS